MAQINTKGHVGIFGPTLCGKSFLMKAFARHYHACGIPSIVLDPVKDEWGEWPEGSFVTDDAAAFMAAVTASKGCALFVDECGDMIKRNPEMSTLFTWSRHNRHKMHAGGHDAASLLPVMRRQLTTLCIFISTRESLNLFETDVPGLKLPKWVEELADYEFCLFMRGGIPQKVKLK